MHLGGLALQHLLDEVVDEVAVVPGELRDERPRVLAPRHRQRGELERGDPALGASLERRHLARGEREPHRAGEVGRSLVLAEPQVRRPDLDQLAAGAQAGQGEGRIGPRDQHEVEPVRGVLEQEGQLRVHVEGADHVVVVEHEHHLALP